MVRVKDENFFLPPNPNKKVNKWISKVPEDIQPSVRKEVGFHRHVRLRIWENVLLYISDSWIGFIIP
jgi:hypothetical protein